MNPGLAPVGGVPADCPYCALQARMTATDGMFANTQGFTAADTNYPYVEYWVNLTNANGQLACGANPLDGQDSGVTSQYTGFGEPAQFCYYVDCDGGPMGNQCETVRTCPTAPGNVTIAQSGGTLTVTSPSGSATSTFAPPASASTANVVDCCAEDCCEVPQ